MESWELRVDRADLSETDIGPGPDLASPLGEDQVRLAVDLFAMTANNVTYAVMGETMHYWDFFPTDEGWGVVPVWGYADVVSSNHADVTIGDRFYGYFPTASHLVVDAARVTDRGFTDGAAHRAPLPSVYNQYVRTAGNPDHPPAHEALNCLLRPLFITSFFIDDLLDDVGCFDADAVVISSASSKTAVALAFCLHRRSVATIGLTAAANTDFVAGLGWYDEVLPYEDASSLGDDGRALVYVDMSGNADVRAAIHRNVADLRASVMVGATHWEELGGDSDLPGPRPELFFAPTQIARRVDEWGQEGVDVRVSGAWTAFVDGVSDRLSIEEVHGPEAARSAYLAALHGSADPSVGVIVHPQTG